MNNYENSKKARRIASVIYLLIMAVILGGTYLSEQKKALTNMEAKNSALSKETAVVFSDTQVRD